jgi:hypothetical protein
MDRYIRKFQLHSAFSGTRTRSGAGVWRLIFYSQAKAAQLNMIYQSRDDTYWTDYRRHPRVAWDRAQSPTERR